MKPMGSQLKLVGASHVNHAPGYLTFSMRLAVCFFLCCNILHGESQKVSLKNALGTALRRNTSISYHEFGVIAAERDVDVSRAIYSPSFEMDAGWERNQLESLRASGYEEEVLDATMSLSKRHSLGGRSAISINSSRDEIDFVSSGYETNSYNTFVSISYAQPLLRGAGTRLTNLDIEKAGIRKDFSVETLEDSKNTTLHNVYSRYFDLYLESETLRLRRYIRQKLVEIHKIVHEKVEKRKLPVTDLHKVQVTLAVEDSEILGLRRSVVNRLNALTIAVYSRAGTNRVADISFSISAEHLLELAHRPDFRGMVEKAKKNDLELLGYISDYEELEKDRLKAMNDLKPELTLSIEGGIDSYGTDGYVESLDEFSAENYKLVVAGSLALPLINDEARNSLLSINAKSAQLKIAIHNRESEIEQQIEELRGDLETVRQRIRLNEKIVRISKDNLENEMKRLVAEKSTVLDTLVFQTDLIKAELELLKAKLDHVKKLGDYLAYRRGFEQLIGKLPE